MSSVPVKKLAIGVIGFEPTTSRSQSGCATKLRYTPIHDYLVRCISIIPIIGGIINPPPQSPNQTGLAASVSTM
jgi:hypothetical protein